VVSAITAHRHLSRLAQLAQAQLSGLADFQQTCRGVPQTISLGTSNSVLEWVVLPQIAEWPRLFGNILFELYSGRTNELVRRLTEIGVSVKRSALSL
jgi:hypothetical protein